MLLSLFMTEATDLFRRKSFMSERLRASDFFLINKIGGSKKKKKIVCGKASLISAPVMMIDESLHIFSAATSLLQTVPPTLTKFFS